MKQFLDSFEQSLHHLSVLTRKAYRRDLNKLVDYCQQQQIDRWQQLDIHHIRAFIAWRHRQGSSSRSLQRQLSSTRTFFNYLLDQGEMRSNPAQGVRAPKSGKKLPRVLDVDQMASLLESDDREILSLRDHAMFELLYSSGLRVAELANLQIRDVDLSAAMVHVTGKGNKQRNVPVGKQAVLAVRAWLGRRHELDRSGTSQLFLGSRGKAIGSRSIQHRLSLWAKKQGLDMHVHPHMLRHSFASHMLESSGDLRAVQELLGHADISTTQVYTHLDFQHLAKVYDQAHPRARKKPEDK